MRWIYLAIIILFAGATIIFALQNFEIVTVSLFGFGFNSKGRPSNYATARSVFRLANSSTRPPCNGREERYLIVACTVNTDVPEVVGP
jgi:hypothetical protein